MATNKGFPYFNQYLEKQYEVIITQGQDAIVERYIRRYRDGVISETFEDEEGESSLKKWMSLFVGWHARKSIRQGRIFDFKVTRGISDKIQKDFISNGVKLIKAWGDYLIDDRVQDKVIEAVAKYKDDGVKAITSGIRAVISDQGYKSKFWARDQFAKLNATADEYKATKSGYTRFQWLSSRDNRVRPEHVNYNGKVFNYKEGVNGLKPGQAPNCRCVAIPKEI